MTGRVGRRVVAAVVALFSVACFAQVPAPVRVERLTGVVRRLPAFPSKILGNTRTLTVYLPPDYDKSKGRRYPVLYMQDGQNLFSGVTSFIPNQEWRMDETAEALIRGNLIEPLIVVGIDNAGAARANEYLPTRILREDGSGWGGQADRYARMLLEEIKPLIDRTYRTKKDRANTAVGGSSLGGVLALYLGLSLPDRFGKVLAMSPSLWWDDRYLLRRARSLSRRPSQTVWIDMGTNEGSAASAPGYVEDARSFAAALQTKGWRMGRDLTLYIDPGAAHNEDAWARRLGAALMFLFPWSTRR